MSTSLNEFLSSNGFTKDVVSILLEKGDTVDDFKNVKLEELQGYGLKPLTWKS